METLTNFIRRRVLKKEHSEKITAESMSVDDAMMIILLW